MKKSQGVLIFGSILAALQFLAAASALGEVIGKETFAIFVIGVGAVQVGWAAYQQQQVVPLGDTAAFVDKSNRLVAGPASGVANGQEVAVSPAIDPGKIRAENLSGGTITSDKLRNEKGNMHPTTVLMWALVVLVVLVILFYVLIPGLSTPR